jgi:site-specific recombinase
MKFFFLRLWIIWRRFRRGAHQRDHHLQYAQQAEALMRRANPFASWNERANWMIDIAEWVRREPKVSLLEEGAWRRVKHQRTRFLLDWLDAHRETRRLVQATIQKTLREAAGPELFSATGLPREPAFFTELFGRMIKFLLPKPPARLDLSGLFTAMFPEPADADWLLALDHKSLSRIWKLCADDGILHTYMKQIDEALTYLVTVIVSVGVSPAFRQRLEPKMPLQATPFMSLRRELEKYLLTGAHDEAALRSVRMLIAVCQAQTDRIYAHLDEYGVSVDLVYRIERMRAQLGRMARLLDLRAVAPHPSQGQGAGQVQALLVDLIAAHHHRTSVRGLVRRSFFLLARKMVERNADHGEQYMVRNRTEYRAMLKAGCIGGAAAAPFTVLCMSTLSGIGPARFFEGMFTSICYSIGFLLISAIGGVLAARQPAVTAPALASRIKAPGTAEGLRTLLSESALLLRAQASALLGNLATVIPIAALISMIAFLLSGAPLIREENARASLDALSLLGPTPLYAVMTGILLWMSSLAAGFADNWFALMRLKEALAHDRRLVYALGTARAARWAVWLEQHVAGIVGNISLGVLLGMTPIVAQFFGLPLDVRHVTLAAGTLAAAAGSLGSGIVMMPEFWLAVISVVTIGLLNVGIAFSCSLALALRARDVPARIRRLVYRSLLSRIVTSPRFFLLPAKEQIVATPVSIDQETSSVEHEKRANTRE